MNPFFVGFNVAFVCMILYKLVVIEVLLEKLVG